QVAEGDFSQYDGFGELQNLNWTGGSVALDNLVYTYNTGGLLSTVQRTSKKADNTADNHNSYNINFGDDADNQLMSESGQAADGGTLNVNDNWDAEGNATGGDNIVVHNQLWQDANFFYQYDGEGNLIRKTNRSTGESWFYGFDVGNELVEVLHSRPGQALQ